MRLYLFLSKILCAYKVYEEYEENNIENIKEIWDDNTHIITYISCENGEFWLNDTEFIRKGVALSIDYKEFFKNSKYIDKESLVKSFNDMIYWKNCILSSDNILELGEALINYNVFRIEYLEYIINELERLKYAKENEFNKNRANGIYENGKSYYFYKTDKFGKLKHISGCEYEEKNLAIVKYNFFRSKIMSSKLAGEYPKIKLLSIQNIPHVAYQFNNYVDSNYEEYKKETTNCLEIIKNSDLTTPAEWFYVNFEHSFKIIERTLKNLKHGKPFKKEIYEKFNWDKLLNDTGGNFSVTDIKLYIYLCKYLNLISMDERLYCLKKTWYDLYMMAVKKADFFSEYFAVGKDASYESVLEFCNDFSLKNFNSEKYQIFLKSTYIMRN
ncbi:hypothetical protein SLOPH_1122 [Spraguea lophii 42_110]|uniref:Uncharacterized protein n=1 Tax=Spraguea lophii (strain 42_110) TaxID=1358809 RepID=S7XLP3_SPRLO|nr:hypothetical protein SLOPH_1122 [Spraguea lophii 42_110]